MTMLIQIFAAVVSVLLTTEQISAVVNNSKKNFVDDDTALNNITNTQSTSGNVKDSLSSATEQESTRREAGLDFGANGLDSYAPTGSGKPVLPIPVYGVPDGPSNNIVYPAPPPDIPPPLPTNFFGHSTSIKNIHSHPISTFGSSHSSFSSSFDSLGISDSNIFAPPPPPSANYGPPIKSTKPFFNSFHGPKQNRPRPPIGPPSKPLFVQKLPKPIYGPPKNVYGPPKAPLFVPHKNKQQSVTIITVPSNDYNSGSSGLRLPPVGHYGPPDPVSHGPPHPGIPAPPTPPDIKYDGWQPIPGLVSKPPTHSYDLHHDEHFGLDDSNLHSDLTPPPAGYINDHGSSLAHLTNQGYSSSGQGVKDSYGAPLNTVTGSGAIVTSSGDAHHDSHSLSLGLSAAGIKSEQNHLSVIKSIGFELYPNSHKTSAHIGDSYGAPPLSSYSPNGPYAAAHSYKTNGLDHGVSFSSIKTQFSDSHGLHGSDGLSHFSSGPHNTGHNSHDFTLTSSTFGLIPPSGVYGTSSSGYHGTPLLSKPNFPLNALKINPPQHPVIFREPVPSGLIESVGKYTAHKDSHGITQSSGYSGSSYIPPPVPEVTKPVREEEPQVSNLYSLPEAHSAVSFNNLEHGYSSSSSDSFGFNSGAVGGLLTSYAAPLGSIDGSYGLPLHSGGAFSSHLANSHSGHLSVGLDNSHPPLTIDLTSSTSNLNPVAQAYTYQNFPQHDCLSHKSQHLSLPTANSYTAALSSLTTNIGNANAGSIPSLIYGTPDLQTAYSEKFATNAQSDLQSSTSKKVITNVAVNSISDSSSSKKTYGKQLSKHFGPESELVKSESLDINNIPVQGSFGSYTLQIQPAESLGDPKSFADNISHADVLNDGLLHSIISAIEEPHRKDVRIFGQPLANFNQGFDSGRQHTVTNVAASSPVTEVTIAQKVGFDEDASLLDDNKIALYFSNNSQNHKTDRSQDEDIRNGQQYGSYGTFKSHDDSSSDKTQETKEKV